jgi:hypothetical protein
MQPGGLAVLMKGFIAVSFSAAQTRSQHGIGDSGVVA